jgi:hypothetical protein
MENAMLNPNIQSAVLRQPRDECAGSRGTILGNRNLWLALAAVLLIAGLALNWNWLAAAGIAPLLLVLLPCGAMCALHLCSRKAAEDGSRG